MSRLTHPALLCLVLLLLAGSSGSRPAGAAVVVPQGFVDEPILTSLSEPNSMAFLPDGRLLFTEQRTGNVRVVANGALGAAPALTVPALVSTGYEQGLQGIAVDPDWPVRPYVYLYHDRTGAACRVVRYTAVGDLTDPASTHLTLETPLLLIDDVPDNDPRHNSGCLRFGPDGHLYVSLGEDEDFCGAQDSTVLKGAILRLDVRRLGPTGGGPVPRDSIVPATYPLASASANARLVWAFGLRNPWRFHVDPVTGLLYGVDVGEGLTEEVNEIHAGDDLGWPYREGYFAWTRDCPFVGRLPYRDPIYAWDRPVDNTAFVGAGIYRRPTGAAAPWPLQYEGNVFYAEYYRGWLRRLRKSGTAWSPAPAVPGQPDAESWATGLVTAVDFLVGPDGSLWWMAQFDDAFAAGSGSLHRIRATTIDSSGGAAPAALALAPNPFADRTTFELRLPSPRDVSVAIFDLSGRRVRRLFRGEAGPVAILPWDGTDDAGRALPAGVYLARLEGQGIGATARVLRLR